MKSFFHFKITFLMISSLVPWPVPNNSTANCSREFSFTVRKFVEKKWTPIFDKYKLDIPLSCPLNPERDIFHVFHQSKFSANPRRWSCGICGKSFYKEIFLDLHFFRKHPEKLFLVEDSVCPAEFCDLIRCEVLQLAELNRNHNSNQSDNNSDESQSSKERQQTITALVKASPQVTPLGHRFPDSSCLSDDEQCRKKGWLMIHPSLQSHAQVHCCNQSPNKTNSTFCPNGTSNSEHPPHPVTEESRNSHSKEAELSEKIKKKQSTCKDEDFAQLRNDCARLIDLCTSGLILKLTNHQFNHLRDDLNQSVCWHLQCDRYWTEVIQNEPSTPTLLLVAVAFLIVGLATSYVIVCVLFQDSQSITQSRHSSQRTSSRRIKSTEVSALSVEDSNTSRPSQREAHKNGMTADQWNPDSSSASSAISSSHYVKNKRPSSSHYQSLHYSAGAHKRRLEPNTFVIEAEVEENSLI